MRRCSSPTLQFLATAMSSRHPLYRGGRNHYRRGFSDRTYSVDRDQFISGDSHLRSVRDANRGFRPPSRGNFNPRPPPINYGPPHFDQNQPFHQNQPFRSRPQKPLDYRNWEYARQRHPPDCDRFTVLSYNILADYLAIDHRNKLYFHIPHHILDWEWRKRNIFFELGLWSADILCFQEVDRFHDLEEELKVRGYCGIWKMRTGNPVDGCAIFWRFLRFKLLHEESIEFNKLGLRDNVAQICVLELINQKDKRHASAVPASSAGSNKVVICNIHVLYNPKRGEIKLGQVRVLLNRAYAVSKLWDNAPVVLCGDFNCTPKSPLYNFISEQKLDLSELPRDKISGQASAEIRAPRPFISNQRVQPSDDSAHTPTMVEDREVEPSDALSDDSAPHVPTLVDDREFMQSDTLDIQKPNDLASNHGGIPSSSSLSEPQGNSSVLNVCSSSCLTTQEDDVCDVGSTLPIQASGSNENQVGCSVNHQKEGGIHEHLTVNSRHEDLDQSVSKTGFEEDLYHSVIKTGCRKDLYDTPNTLYGSSNEDCRSKLRDMNESLNCEGDNKSTGATSHPEAASAVSLDIYSSELVHETSFSKVLEATRLRSSEHMSSLSVTNEKSCSSREFNISYKSSSIDSLLDEKMENLSLDKQVEDSDNGTLGEESTIFLSALHDNDIRFPSDFDQFPRSNSVGSIKSSEYVADPNSQQLHPPSSGVQSYYVSVDFDPAGLDRSTYNPSAWTPMEIETATGNSDCTLMEHPLKLRSTYSEVEDSSGTRDSNGEPLVTSYHRCFSGTVDYIWRSEGVQTVRVLAPIPKHAMQWTCGFPTKKWGSDHIALVSELAFTKRCYQSE